MFINVNSAMCVDFLKARKKEKMDGFQVVLVQFKIGLTRTVFEFINDIPRYQDVYLACLSSVLCQNCLKYCILSIIKIWECIEVGFNWQKKQKRFCKNPNSSWRSGFEF